MKKLTLILLTLFASTISQAQDAKELPELPYNDWGACPFECCTYREWVAEEKISVFEQRNEKSPVAFRLKKNEHVIALTGVVVTHKVGVTKILQPVKIGYLPKGTEPMLSLSSGDKVYPLHYAGEGNDVFWYRGSTYIDEISVPDNGYGEVPNIENVKVISRPKNVWWAKLRNKNGKTGWTSQTNRFSNQDACG